MRSTVGNLGKSTRLRKAIVASMVIVVLLLAFIAIRKNSQSAKLAAMLQAVRDAGEPVTEEEWNEHFAAQAGMTEASTLWLHATNSVGVALQKPELASLNVDGLYDEWLPLPNYAEYPDALEALVAYLASIELELAAVQAAVDSHELAFYPFDHREIDAGRNEICVTSLAAALMALQTLARLHQGDLAGATDSLSATLGCAKAMDGNPNSQWNSLRYDIETLYYRCAAELIQDENLSAEALAQLQEEVRSINHRENLKWGIFGERISGLVYLTTAKIDYPLGVNLRATPRAKMRCIDSATQSIAALELPWHEGLMQVDRIDDSMNASHSFFDDLFLTSVLPHSIDFRFAAEGVALAHSLDVLIAAELFRREHGQLPKSIEELVPGYLPEVPPDPFDGKPLRYVVNDEGALAYSVGRNRTDDHGKFKYSEPMGVRPDLGFSLKRPLRD